MFARHARPLRPLDAALAPALGVACALVYLRALGCGFWSDDYQWLGRMAATLERPSYLFTVFYRDFNPVLHASFLADWLLGDARAATYHATSLAVHAAAVALVYLLCRRVGASPAVAAAAGGLWGIGSRLSEAVIWPAARGHELATALAVAALLALGSPRRVAKAASLGLALLALLSKETALFPLVLAPMLVPEPRRTRGWLVALGLLLAAFAIWSVASKPALHLSARPASELVLKIPFIVLRPLGLGDLYDFTWPTFGLVVVVLAMAAWALRRTSAIVGFAWIALALVPLVPLDKLSSRYLYLLAVGWAIVLCGTVEHLRGRFVSPALRRIAAVSGGVALAAVALANVLLVQREIEDYRVLAQPEARLVAALRPEIAGLAPGETLVVVDLSPRDAIATLAGRLAERGTIAKLLPYRAHAVSGLVDLQDAVNLVRGHVPGLLGVTVDPLAAERSRVVTWNGAAIAPAPPGWRAAPRDRLFATRWGPAGDYFAAPPRP